MTQSNRSLGRLKKRSEFLFVRDGKYAAIGGVVVQVRPNPNTDDQIRAGFTATKKIGNAVMRNRVRRRLKHAVNLVLPLYGRPGHDYVFIARHNTLSRPYKDLCKDIERALNSFASATRPD